MHWVRRNELPLGRTPSLRLDCRGLCSATRELRHARESRNGRTRHQAGYSQHDDHATPNEHPDSVAPEQPLPNVHTCQNDADPLRLRHKTNRTQPGQLPDAARLVVLGSRSPSYTALDVSRHGRRIYHLRRDPDSALVAGARDARIRLSTWSGYLDRLCLRGFCGARSDVPSAPVVD